LIFLHIAHLPWRDGTALGLHNRDVKMLRQKRSSASGDFGIINLSCVKDTCHHRFLLGVFTLYYHNALRYLLFGLHKTGNLSGCIYLFLFCGKPSSRTPILSSVAADIIILKRFLIGAGNPDAMELRPAYLNF